MTSETKLGGLHLKNPVILASGTFDKSIIKEIDINKIGGIVTKTVTILPRAGNPLPRIIKTKCGWLNSNGWQNSGIKNFIGEDLRFWQRFDTEIIPSIGGFSEKEYVKLTQLLNRENINALEVNVSCPNVEHGLSFGNNAKILTNLIKKIRKNFNKSLIVKLSPNVIDITSVAKAALDGGADIISLVNTIIGLEIDNKKRKAAFARKIAGYSGPAIKPIALRMVWEVYKNLKCPIIGGGGISDFDDALDYIMVGASAVSIGSGIYLDRRLPEKVFSGFEKYFRDQKIKNINQIKGII